VPKYSKTFIGALTNYACQSQVFKELPTGQETTRLAVGKVDASSIKLTPELQTTLI